MSLPHLLLVDDSEAVLAFEKAALSGHYAISTASTGREALEQLRRVDFDAVLLDLSMPEMDGDEVLVQMQRDPRLWRVPVVVISSETQRQAEVLRKGARAFLGKPVRAQEVLPLVERILEESRLQARAGNLATLIVSAGHIEVGLPIDSIRVVLHQLATRPLPLGPSYLSRMIILHGEPIPVLDLPRRLGVKHAMPPALRKLVVVQDEAISLAICVDGVRDPEELPASDITSREKLAGSTHGALREALIAVAQTSRGPLPILDPRALVSRELLRKVGMELPR
jgi:CheY-like chemotaxis protein/chemotaxis signal transduction protein